jgi:hypothetical protein
MTEFDKQLIKKAETFRCWNYRDIDVLISIADTKEAKDDLHDIRTDLYDLVMDTL